MADKTMKEKLERTHKRYAKMLALWRLYFDAYYGSGGFEDGTYIVRYPKESEKKYKSRKELVAYLNYCQPIIDIYNGYIYKKPITRDCESKEITDIFWKDVKGGESGVTIDEFAKEVLLIAQIYGSALVVVDKSPMQAKNQLEKKENRLYPYAYVLSPESMTDWAEDSNGSLIWAKIKEIQKSQAGDPFGEHEEIINYRVWTREGWSLYSEAGDLLETAEHSLGVVPIIRVNNKKDVNSSVAGVSDIAYISKLNKKIFNYMSEVDDLLRSQTFAILLYPTVDAGSLTGLSIGTDRILSYSPDSPHKPEYIAPPPEAVAAYEARLIVTVEEIYRTANLKYNGGATPSGVALRFEFEPTQQVLIAKAQTQQAFEEKLIRLWALWEDTSYDDLGLNIDYPTDFNLSDLGQEVAAALDVLSLDISDTFNVEYKKSLSRKILPNIDNKIQDTIDKEIVENETLTESQEELDGITQDGEEQ